MMRSEYLRVGLIGLGAVCGSMAELVEHDPGSPLDVVGAVVRDATRGRDTNVVPVESLDALLEMEPDVIAEAAGHAALRQLGPACLNASVPLVILSVGALADESVEQMLRDAAAAGHVTVAVASGGVGGLDLIASAAQGTLTRVVHTIIKPPRALGVQATTRTEIQRGSAREAATLFPQNANVAASVALAGLGLDRSEVIIVADPEAQANRHEIDVQGGFGRFQMRIDNRPSPTNPRTAAIVAMSLKHALEKQRQLIAIG